MKRLTKMFKGGQKGFTLIELLIVIVILGVLAAAIIPNLSKFVGSGQLGAANAELAAVRTAVSAYQADHNALLPCTVQPTVGPTEEIVLSASISPAYIDGTIKGIYKVDQYGKIVTATPGVDAATGWPLTIVFSRATLKWEKGTGVYGTYP